MNYFRLLTVILFLTIGFSCSKHDSVGGGGGTINPVPVITTIAPMSATVGDPAFTLTVTGSNFISGSVVNWNGSSLATTFVSATQLTAIVNAPLLTTAGTANITVFNATPGGGTSNVVVFTISAQAATNPVPTTTSISPASVTAGSTAFTLTVTGTNFINGSVVYWNGAALTTTFVGPLQLTAAVTAPLVATAGTAAVTVVTPAPGGGTSNTSTFTITAVGNNPVPTVTSISPISTTAGNPAFTLTVTGTNFINGSVVNWNGSALTTTFVNATQLTAAITAPLIATAGTANITVFNGTPGGGNSNAVAFTINPVATNPVPTATSLSPASVTAGAAAFTLTVNGTNFIASSTIKWNGSALTTTFVNGLQLTATVSAALVTTAGTVPVTVVTPAPGGGTSNTLTFTINAVGNNPIPTLVSITPISATAGAAAFTLTANGSNFINTSAIKWNGTALTTTYVSGTQLTAAVSAALVATAGSASVTVFNTTPGGGTSGAVTFTINPAGTTAKKFLFDATKAETAGNADWVIDEDGGVPQRIPTPAQSTVTSTTPETYWTGAISSWGIALAKLGHTVETLPSTGTITYGNSSNAQDLSNYDVFVVDEPNIRFTTAEKQAILSFVNNGGGLFMISDHTGSDRNNDGWDSPAIWNDLMTNNGSVTNPFGFSVDLTNISEISSNVLTGNPSNVILHGSQGNVTQLQFNNGATLTLNSTANPNVQGLVWQNTYAQSTTHAMSASSTYGTGRVYCVTDSSPMDDGTGASGNSLYVSWPLYSHTQLFMNASLWLAKLQ